MPALNPGVKGPSFELDSLDGTKLGTASIQKGGKGVLVFFKETCPTCQLAMPYLSKLASHHQGDSKVQVWGIAQEPKERAAAFVQSYGLKLPVLLDSSPFRTSKAYGLTHVPTVFLVDDEGKIEKTIIGFSKKEYEELAETVAKNSGQSPANLFEGSGAPDYKPG